MANRLNAETSPYLRQHAANPVDWYPWGPEAFEAARDRDVPVLLSVGYSSCHWCHVMAHESFEDPETAERMNARFVNVKVDREERPDVDAVYMEATQAMTGRGGWPMTVFMTPDGEPFFCGTYFPTTPRAGQPSFTQLLDAVSDAWTDKRSELLEQADRLVRTLGRSAAPPENAELPGRAVLDEATLAMLAAHDTTWGGFGRAPKFPQAMSLGHLLRHHHRSGSRSTLEAVMRSLDAMASGGIYDHLGGGFSRYSVDERWLVPHFEKMLYDNALLARSYLWAWQVTGEERYAQVVTETLGYVLGTLSHPDGGRYSAEDADSIAHDALDGSPPEEGAFYVWTPAEMTEALREAGLGGSVDAVLEWYGVTDAGNFEGASIPHRLHARGQLARPGEIEEARVALLAARALRPRPGLDDKVLTEWNALAITVLAEAGAAMGRADWVDAATATATFLCERLAPADPKRSGRRRWHRSWQAEASDDATGGARHLAYAADHAALVEAFLALHEATGERRWLDEAVSTADDLLELFWDTGGALWSTGDDAEELVSRPKDLTDDATPSANSAGAVALLRLGAHTGQSRYGEHARSILASLGDPAGRHPLAFGHLLWAVSLETDGITEVVVSGDRPELVAEVHRRFTPNVVLAWGEPTDLPLWEGRTETGSDGRGYVCRDQVCGAPATTVDELVAQLR